MYCYCLPARCAPGAIDSRYIRNVFKGCCGLSSQSCELAHGTKHLQNPLQSQVKLELLHVIAEVQVVTTLP